MINATRFDLYFADPIGNKLLTSISYQSFTKNPMKMAEKISESKMVFILDKDPMKKDYFILFLIQKQFGFFFHY